MHPVLRGVRPHDDDFDWPGLIDAIQARNAENARRAVDPPITEGIVGSVVVCRHERSKGAAKNAVIGAGVLGAVCVLQQVLLSMIAGVSAAPSPEQEKLLSTIETMSDAVLVFGVAIVAFSFVYAALLYITSGGPRAAAGSRGRRERTTNDRVLVPFPIAYRAQADLDEHGNLVANVYRRVPVLRDGLLAEDEQHVGAVTLADADENAGEMTERFDALLDEITDATAHAATGYRAALRDIGVDPDDEVELEASLRATWDAARDAILVNDPIVDALNAHAVRRLSEDATGAPTAAHRTPVPVASRP